jgi:serine protease
VAVLDTGQTDHEDLVGNMVPGYDFIDDTFVSRDGDGRDSDPDDPGDWTERGDCGFGSPASNSSWHGTHVAGTVAALTNNGIGLAGVAYEAKVQHVRVLGRCGGYLSDISDGVVWASGGPVSGAPVNATPASVINMSLGGSGSCGTTYQAAIDEAVANGATVVVSAGNSNANAANFRPASCAGVITVAATDRFGDRASYSNYGSTVEISAPGGDSDGSGNGVASTLNDGTTVQGNDIYVYYQGTSMAAPHISGLAAMMYSTDPTITPAQVLSIMQSTARDLPGTCTGGCGAGIADAHAALLAMGGPVDPPPPPPPPADEPPAAPSSLVASANQTGKGKNKDLVSVTLTWNDNSGNENGFEIQACVESGKGRTKTCPYASIAQVGADVESWVDTSQTDGRRYQVRALGDAGNSAWSNEASF